jgi:predicted MFS family arabinose efflux permease
MPVRHMARNLFLLTLCQAVGQAGNTMMFTATALSVSGVLQIHDLATLPVTMQHLGVMLSVFPAAMLMQRKGRGFGALTLNGVGWNFLFVGATTLVTTTYRPAERGKAQALNDFLVFGTTATCSFLAGLLQNRLGWLPLNWMSVALVMVAVVAVGWLHMQPRRTALA